MAREEDNRFTPSVMGSTFAALVVWPFQRFFSTTAKGGVLLLGASVLAMVAANTGLKDAYHALWEVHLSVSVGGLEVDKNLHHWINDGLMAVFFFLVGLEIKREVLSGELSEITNAALPVAAAVGGMVVPAAFYLMFNLGGPAENGWGVPMATDIAFSLGILALLGSRAPSPLIIFLTALAIVDDIGGILVIAAFYTEALDLASLAGAGGLVVASFAINRLGVRKTTPYVLLGIVMWVLLLKSGVHATVAGVLLAMTIPANRKISHRELVRTIQDQLQCLGKGGEHPEYCPLVLDRERQQAVIVELEQAVHDAEAPLQHIEHHLHPWVTYLVIPVFAFANAGIDLSMAGLAAAAVQPVFAGIVSGLFLGKQIGIVFMSWLVVKLGLAQLPGGVGWAQLWGVSILAGVGFTMSLFIGGLAFKDPALVESAKTATFTASVLSGVAGYVLLRLTSPEGEPGAGARAH